MNRKIRNIKPEDLSEFLRNYCSFNRDSAYILTAMARPKENEQIEHGNMPAFREIISDESDIEQKTRKLLTLGRNYTPSEGGDLSFRMYITANSRDALKAFHMYQKGLVDMSRHMSNGHDETYNHIKTLDKEWQSTLQSDTNKESSQFIIDIDTKDEGVFLDTTAKLQEMTSINHMIETPNGYHIIVEPFNYNELEHGEDIEIKKDSLMFLTMI